MAVIKDSGIVLKEYPSGENNSKLVLLTERHGKITAFARGSRRTQSKLSVAMHSYNEFIIFDGGGFYSLNQVTPLHTFGKITTDYDKYCFGCCFLEMTDKMILPKMEAGNILRILLGALSELEKDRHTPKLVFAVFAIKFLQMEGVMPTADDCTAYGVQLSSKAKNALTYILDADINKVFAFGASCDVQSQLFDAAVIFVNTNADIQLSSLKVMGEML